MTRAPAAALIAAFAAAAFAVSAAAGVTREKGDIEGCVSVLNKGPTTDEKIHIRDRMARHHKGRVKATGTANMTKSFVLDANGMAIVPFTFTKFGPTTYTIFVDGTPPASYTIHFTLGKANDVTMPNCTLSN